jgi:acetylornithine deacetylase/succinyl-diaminopimelate desuccinylase-like protein
MTMRYAAAAAWPSFVLCAAAAAQPAGLDWAALEAESLRHFQALVSMDTSDPPGNEQPAHDYLKRVLEAEGIAVQTFVKVDKRPNLVARLAGSGRKRPLLIMAHTDVVNVDASKWRHPPFAAARDGGYVYGRGTVDDKDNVTAALMAMLVLKRTNAALDRDVIFLAEAGEEGNTWLGIEFMVNEHFAAIDAEYCLAEGGSVVRRGGEVRYATIDTAEKVPNGVDLVAHGISGHGSAPLQTNAIAHLAKAIVAVTAWQPPVMLNDTTRTYFTRLATIAEAEPARRYRDVLSGDAQRVAAADEWLRANEPTHASMLRTSISPNIVQGGYRNNVIPSEAKVTLDVRMRPGEDAAAFLAKLNEVIGDPSVEAKFNGWPPTSSGKPRIGGVSSIDNDGYAAIERTLGTHYQTTVLPTMLPAATDMAFLREKGVQCYGINAATDDEDAPQGFGPHSDQERLLEAELHRFVRFNVDVVTTLARSGGG